MVTDSGDEISLSVEPPSAGDPVSLVDESGCDLLVDAVCKVMTRTWSYVVPMNSSGSQARYETDNIHDVLVLAAEHQLVVLEGSTGRERWKRWLDQPVTDLFLYARRDIVATLLDDRVCLTRLSDGSRVGCIELPEVAVSGRLLPNGKLEVRLLNDRAVRLALSAE